MSRLGGNSPSADTDKSNNLQGEDGAPGQVQTIVGGTNCSVDSGDVNNPIINADAKASPTTTKGDVIARGAATDERVAVGTDGQVLVADAASSAGVKFADAAGGGENTTKGDLEGFSTVAARIPVGTNDQVLTADSTAALGVAWKDAAGGGGGALVREYESMIPLGATSGSANATKGGWFQVLTNMTVSAVAFGCKFAAGADYTAYVAKEAATANEVDSIIATAVTITNTGDTNQICWAYMDFAATFDLDAGERYAFALMRTDGTGSAVCELKFEAVDGARNNDIIDDEIFAKAQNTVPTPGTDLTVTAGFVVPLRLTYVRR